MGSRKKTTVGYKYFLGMHYVFCHGPIDAVTHVYFDDNTLAWRGNWTDATITIDKPDLFGGDDKEGGFVGTLELVKGDSTALNAYLLSVADPNMVSSYYGVTSIVQHQSYLGNSPYIKPMSIVVQSGGYQWPGKAQWYPEKAFIPWDAVPVDGGGSVFTPNDANLRNNVDLYLVYAGSTVTDDGGYVTDMIKGIRDAIAQRLSAVPALDEVRTGTLWDYSTVDKGSPVRDSEQTQSIASGEVFGDTSSPSSFDPWENYDVTSTIGGNASEGVVTGPFIVSDYSLVLGHLWRIGDNATSRNTYRNAVVIYVGDEDIDVATQMLDAQARYEAETAGGTFQLHIVRPEHFRRTVSPFSFASSRVSVHAQKILENYYPDGSDTDDIEWDDGINLDTASVDEADLPSRQGSDVNPVHILRECLISPIIGRNEPEELIDDTAAMYAADLLFDEAFGLSPKWSNEEQITEYMQTICDHANITVYVSDKTGLWVIKPIRGDYDVNTIPELHEDTDILSVDTIERRRATEGVNAITVKYYDIDRDDTATVPVYNPAAIQQAGGKIDPTTVYYDAILREDLARAVGERDLITLSYPVVTGSIYVDRRFYYFEPGDVFILNAPKYAVFGEVMRVGDVDYVTEDDNKIRLDFASDIYNLEPQRLPVESEYVPPPLVLPPAIMNYRYVEEACYFLGCLEMGKASLDAALANDPDAGAIFCAGPPPASSLASAYVYAGLYPGGTFEPSLTLDFSPSVRLSSPVSRIPTEEVISYGKSWRVSGIVVGDLAALGSELVRIKAIDTTAKTVTVARGVFDTVPTEHASGEVLIMLEAFGGFAENNYTSELTVDVRLLPFSGNARVDIDDARQDLVTLESRAIRPYPVADFKVGGAYVYEIDELEGPYELTWVHRNRQQQTNTLAGYTESGFTPEPGSTCRFRVRAFASDGSDLPYLVDIDIGSVTSYTFDPSALVIPPEAVRLSFAVIVVRDGYENWSSVSVSSPVPFSSGLGIPYLWYDANQPSSVFSDSDATTPVDSDGDIVALITPVTLD